MLIVAFEIPRHAVQKAESLLAIHAGVALLLQEVEKAWETSTVLQNPIIAQGPKYFPNYVFKYLQIYVILLLGVIKSYSLSVPFFNVT